MIAAVLWTVLAAGVALLLFISLASKQQQQQPKLAQEGAAKPKEKEAGKREAQEKNASPAAAKKEKSSASPASPAAASASSSPPSSPDIEDLIGEEFAKSLVPVTVKQMRAGGVTPYTKEQRVDMLRELDESSSVALPNFRAHVAKTSPGGALKRSAAKVFQLNIGLYCNQACTHCHVDSSPKRKEMMSHDVAEKCVRIIKNSPSVETVDITGGAPELNKEFRYIVRECAELGLDLIDRCNLTVLLEPNQRDLAAFLAEHGVHIIASLPCYLESNVDGQRGDQVFQRSIKALQILNKLGYGVEGATNAAGKPLELDLVYNPTGIHLPPPASKLEGDYKEKLGTEFGISFNKLICITNMPINRFYDYLKEEGKVEDYMKLLVDNYNPATTCDIMCRSYVSVKWDGELFDCDFNQQVDLSLKRKGAANRGITVFDIESADDLIEVPIVTRAHCYGCTAGQGSS